MKIQLTLKYLSEGDEPILPDAVVDFDKYDIESSRPMHLERAPNGDAVRIIPGDETWIFTGVLLAPPLPAAAPGNVWETHTSKSAP